MKFSEAWLREWVDPDVDRATLLEQLTMAGLEVESVESVGGDCSGVVVGKVTQASKHPDADKLSVCQVFDGKDTFQVVCGAPNVREGLVSAFARVGAVLPGEFEIKKAELRGVESQGMLCSAAELNLGEDADGILEFEDELGDKLGNELTTALALDDVTIDLDLTPNRGDCLSVRGLAREIGVLNDVAVHHQATAPTEATIESTFEVELKDPAGCPRYLGRVIEGIDIRARTPFWLTERLRRCGLRSIDPVVDVTNYVMLELGQPMHAFDLNQLDTKIVVRTADAGETITLLDGQEIALDRSTLLITDDGGPVAIAGVMGGERSGVQDDTQDVFLECAYFAPLSIAGTARRFGLHTDASHRYERGVDFDLQVQAMDRATELLLSVVGGQPGPVIESVEASHLPPVRRVSLRQRRLDELLGVAIDTAEVDKLLHRLGFTLVDRTEAEGDGVVWTIEAPSHRFDIAIEADLVEEVCRIYGYNRIPSRTPVTGLALRPIALERSEHNELKRQLAANGFQEVITYSFVDPKLQDLLDPGVEPLALANPMSSEQSVMRSNLLPGLVDGLRSNINRQQVGVRLFELGLCFLPGEKLEQALLLGGLMWGRRALESLHAADDSVDFFDLKGEVERLLEWCGHKSVTYEVTDDSVLHPGQRAAIHVDGVEIGRLGRLHPEIERRLELGAAGTFIFEIVGDAALTRPLRAFSGISKFPSVRRDFAFVLQESVSARQVEECLTGALGDALVEFRLFDLYRGKGIDSNEKSIAVGLTFQDPSATLTEKEISQFVEKAVTALERDLDARLR